MTILVSISVKFLFKEVSFDVDLPMDSGQAIQKTINIYGACQNGFFIAVLLDLSSCRFSFPFV